MDDVLTDLDALGRFLAHAEPRVTLHRVEPTALVASFPDDGGALRFEWEASGALHVRMPIVIAPDARMGDVLELLSDVNADLGVLGFVLHRSAGWVEFRTTLFADPRGRISAEVLGRVIATVHDSAIAILPQLEEACRMEVPVMPSWWGAD